MFSRNSRAWTTTAALALVGAVAVLGTAGHAEASAAVQRASAQPASAFDPMIVHLHGNYETALSHPETVHMAGVDYANGKQPKAPAVAVRSATGTCTEPDCPLPYNGGATQLTPHVYLLLWGPQWESSPGETASATYLQRFFQGLGVEPQDTWSRVLDDYPDSGGLVPEFGSSVFAGTYEDPETPPVGANPAQFAAEAQAFAMLIGLPIADYGNTQIVVATQSGTCPLGFDCPGANGWYCSYHADSLGTTGVPFIALPYIADAGSGQCENEMLGGPFDGYSISAGHEYAETITDPYNWTGYWDSAMGLASGEVADKCEDNNQFAYAALSTGDFAVQQLFSNAAYAATGQGCTFGWPDNITVPNPGTLSTPVHTSVNLPVNATSSADYPLSYSGYLPPGLTINRATGVISGSPTATGTFGTSIDVTDESGAFGSAVFTWTITGTGDTVTVTSPGAEMGVVGIKESVQMTATSSGSHPITFTASGLPPGLGISSAGLISGSPSAQGNYTVRVIATDSTGAAGATDFTWVIKPLTLHCGGKTQICKY